MSAEHVHWVEYVKAFAPFVLLAVSAVFSVLAFFARRTINEFGEQNKATMKRQEQLEKDFLHFQIQLPRDFVLKDDHIRHITIVEKKIDEVGRVVESGLAELNSDVKLILRDLPKRTTDE